MERPARGPSTVLQSRLDVEQSARLLESRIVPPPTAQPAIFARGDSRQRDQVPPAQRGPGRGELLSGRAVVLLRMVMPILARRVPQEQVDHRLRLAAQLTIALDRGARPPLVVLADGAVRLAKQGRGIVGPDRFEVLGQWVRMPQAAILHIASAGGNPSIPRPADIPGR